MTVTITITDPTATEATALRAYLTALHSTAVDFSGVTEAIAEHTEWIGQQTREVIDAVQADAASSSFRSSEVPEFTVEEPTTAADAGAPDFDSAGYPWDERIHASSRATVADGTWRKKRGVSPEWVAIIEAGLAATIDAHASVEGTLQDVIDTVQEQTAPEVPDAPEQDQLTAVGEDTSAIGADVPEAPERIIQTSPIPEVAEASADAPPPPPAATPNPFLAVMSRIGKSKLDKAKKDELLTAAGALDEKGAPSILVLNKRPELIDGFVALLDSEGV